MFVSSIGKSHNSLLNTLSHSSTCNLDHKRAPIALIAKGRPLHFHTICVPIACSSVYASKLPMGNVNFANNDKQYFSNNFSTG
jgi:hypothetical protein